MLKNGLVLVVEVWLSRLYFSEISFKAKQLEEFWQSFGSKCLKQNDKQDSCRHTVITTTPTYPRKRNRRRTAKPAKRSLKYCW